MNPAFLQFKNFIGPYGLNESDFNTLIQFCEIIQFKKGDIVMKDGEVQNSIYFISKGLIRYFILSNSGKKPRNNIISSFFKYHQLENTFIHKILWLETLHKK
jgi:signal-transduction protein with cAMP-binding, CBS, and nucleotidyltransferase domain